LFRQRLQKFVASTVRAAARLQRFKRAMIAFAIE
jgi:hypothetical protein